MKLLIVLAAVALVAVRGDGEITCTAGPPDDEGAANTTVCAANVTQCFSPVAVADNTFAGYGCGPCPNTTTNATCVECTGAVDDACNAYTAPTHSFQCYVNK